MVKCQLCSSQDFVHHIDFGPQPVSHRYSNDAVQDNYRHDIKMAQCKHCGLVQILTPFPIADLVPRYSWLTCTEPEGHLDGMVDHLAQLPGLSKDAKILGLTFKEDTTLRRFNERGFKNTYRFDMIKDFKVTNPLANVESAVDLFDADFAHGFREKYGKADVFICRHVIEHSINIANFIAAIKELTHENSYIVIEIPECGSAFDLYDYTTVWEEHNLYFTPELFKSFLKNSGLNIHSYIQAPYPLEDACIAICQKQPGEAKIEFQTSNYANFVANFEKRKAEIRERLIELKKSGKVALFGAGHMSVAFVNLMGVEDLIDMILDDNVNKGDYFLPGTRLPIRPSSLLYEENIGYCLMSLAPESEEKVSNKHKRFTENGGKFRSIFPKNPGCFLSDNFLVTI